MLSPQAVSSGSDEDFHSLNGRDFDDSTAPSPNDDALLEPEPEPETEPEKMQPPQHPCKSMQGPFEESIEESSNDNADRSQDGHVGAEARRQKLLDSKDFDDAWTTRWRQKPGAQFHPLLKLVAQITFGMHLLQQHQAKSDQEVVKILQTHVDEVDNFLERTTEDFDLALRDIEERIRFLQLPMQHIQVFEIMLEDKKFRMQLLDGNDKIEKIIDRTARAMNAALLDVKRGRQATKELGRYLASVRDKWPKGDRDLDAILTAMCGNEEGWKKCLKDLQAKGNDLGNKLIQLGTVIGEMSKMAAAASRRNTHQSKPSRPKSTNFSDPTAHALRSKFNVDTEKASALPTVVDKPLPSEPDVDGGASTSLSKPKQRPASYHQRFETPRQVPSPQSSSRSKVEATDQRPKTSGSNRAAPNNLDFLQTTSPLSSHPPNDDFKRPKSAGHAHGARATKPGSDQGSAARSKTLNNASHTRVASDALASSTSKPRNRDSYLQERKETVAGSSFARRWSVRKLFIGAEPDYDAQPATQTHRQSKPSVSTAPAPTSPPSRPQKLAPVSEHDDKLSSAAPPQSNSANDPHEPKSRRSSALTGKNTNRYSFLTVPNSRGISPSREHPTPSLASSIKRRSLSLKNLFSRKSRNVSATAAA